MDIEGDVYDLAHYAVHDQCKHWGVRDLDDLLAQVVSKLVAHHIPEDRQNVVDQTFEKRSAIDKPISGGRVLNFSLEHSATGLVEAVEV